MNSSQLSAINDLKSNGMKFYGESYELSRLDRFFEKLVLNEAKSAKLVDESEEFAQIHISNGAMISSKNIEGITLTHSITTRPLQTGPIGKIVTQFNDSTIKIRFPKNTKKELKIIYSSSTSTVHSPLVEIVLEEGAQALIFEQFNAPDDIDVAFLGGLKIELSQGSQMEHIQLKLGGFKCLDHNEAHINIARDAKYRNVLFHTGGMLRRQNLVVDLMGPGAHSDIFALYLTRGHEQSDINTQINHHYPDTTSAQLAKGILAEESKGIFTGKIYIHPKAQRVSSTQLNKNLLLSKKAHAFSRPQLEIFADDVKCSHGSTTGQLSESELFYFQARGIPESKARSLLSHGFGLEIVNKIEHQGVKHKISELILENLKRQFDTPRSL